MRGVRENALQPLWFSLRGITRPVRHALGLRHPDCRSARVGTIVTKRNYHARSTISVLIDTYNYGRYMGKPSIAFWRRTLHNRARNLSRR